MDTTKSLYSKLTYGSRFFDSRHDYLSNLKRNRELANLMKINSLFLFETEIALPVYFVSRA